MFGIKKIISILIVYLQVGDVCCVDRARCLEERGGRKRERERGGKGGGAQCHAQTLNFYFSQAKLKLTLYLLVLLEEVG